MDAAMIEVLHQASSQDPSVFKKAEETLKRWETERGFYTALYNVYSNHSLPVDVRWMAIVYFKNGVGSYWRKSAPNAIAEDEKEFLRQRLIANFDEPVNQIAIQISVTIAKIARLDWPKEWNALIPTLLEAIGGQNSCAQHRAMLTLHHVVKTLASKRILSDQITFRELTSNIFNFILTLWNTYTESFLILVSNNADAQQIQETIEKALLLLRILRQLITHGFDNSGQSEDAMLFLKVIFDRARACLECRKTLISRGLQIETCEKFIIHLTKVLFGISELHAEAFVELIPMSLEFTVYFCFTEEGRPLTFDRFVIQCLNLLNSIVVLKDLRTGRQLSESRYVNRQSRNDTLRRGMENLREEFFTAETLTLICSRLVTHYLLLTPAQLELWETDPEEFAANDVSGAWKYSLRQCTITLFSSLIRKFRGAPTSVLIDLIQRHHQPVDPNDLHAILLKDAVYHAVGLAAFELFDQANFQQWFSTTLKQELKLNGPSYKIIRRRICWLIGRWAQVIMIPKLRPELYKVMIESLNPQEDLVVRLAASDALKLIIDDFTFDAEEFSTFIEPAFSMLFTLLREVNECDTKMSVLFVLSPMIEHSGPVIKPHVNSLTAYLPGLWQESAEHNMLRCAIVSILVRLEKALGSESLILEPLVVDVVTLSCDINQDVHVYLLEDGLELWLALLQNAPAPTPAIMDLFKNMPALLDCSSQNLRLCLHIVQAYVLLSPLEFFCKHGTVVIDAIKYIIHDMTSEAAVVAITLFETCLQAVPQQDPQLIKPLLSKIFENVHKDSEFRKVATVCCSIAARVLLDSKDMFAQVVSELARDIGGDATEESVFARIIEAWIYHLASEIVMERQKLLSLALCSLLSPNSPPIVFQQFSHIVTCIVETLNNITIYGDLGCLRDSLMVSEQPSPSDYENEDAFRRERLSFSDMVHNVSLIDALQNQLTNLRKAMGDQQFQQMLQTLSSEIDQQLKEFVTL